MYLKSKNLPHKNKKKMNHQLLDLNNNNQFSNNSNNNRLQFNHNRKKSIFGIKSQVQIQMLILLQIYNKIKFKHNLNQLFQ